MKRNTLLFGIFVAGLFTSTGCMHSLPNLYQETLNNRGYDLAPTIKNPEIIPGERLEQSKTEIDVFAKQHNLVVLGNSCFEAPAQPQYDAISVAKSLGATHLILYREFTRTSEHNEIRTEYDTAFSTSQTQVFGQRDTFGTIYSPYHTGQLNYNQTSFMTGNAFSTGMASIPYHYQVHVVTPLYMHAAIYLTKAQEEK